MYGSAAAMRCEWITRLTTVTAAPISRSRSSSASHARAWLSAASETGSITVTRVVATGAGSGPVGMLAARAHAAPAAKRRSSAGPAVAERLTPASSTPSTTTRSGSPSALSRIR